MSTFTVLPMSQTIELKAGEVYEGSITVVNPIGAERDFSYSVSVTPYGVMGEEYQVDFSTQTNASQIIEWITIEEPEGTLKPNETREVKFKVTVPETAPAGGQYAALAVRSVESENESGSVQIENVFEIASVLFARVDGETVHDGAVLENSIPELSVENPAKISATLTNNGNVHEAATTTIVVKDAWSGEVVFPKDDDDVNTYIEYIMPGTTRYATRMVDGMNDLGVYQISQKVEYLGETSEVTQTVLMCPIWFMILAGLTVVTLITTIVGFFRRRKKRKIDF